MRTELHPSLIRQLVSKALKEDLGQQGDVTSIATIPSQSQSRAKLIVKENGILCGIKIVTETFSQCDRKIKLISHCQDGDSIRNGETVLEIFGNTRSILAGERTALNFVQHLSGIATLTHRFVQASKGKAKILDTRKTTPTFRIFEKYAVRCGGGFNHRLGLFDMVLIKDNHLAVLKSQALYPIQEAILRCRKRWPRLKIEIECDTLDQVRKAVEAKPDMILLDNMTLTQIRRAVKIIKGQIKIEASGGVTLKTVSAIAKTGVHFISVGAITHSAPVLDFSLEISSGIVS